MSSGISAPPRVAVASAKIERAEWVQVAYYTEKVRLSTLTEIELTLAAPDFSALAGDLLGSQIEISIETPQMGLLLDRAVDLGGAEAAEDSRRQGRRQGRNCRSVFGTVTEVVEMATKPSHRLSLNHHGCTDDNHHHGALLLYHLSVRPRLWVLGQRSRIRVLTDMSIPNIVETVLKEAGFLNKDDYEFRLTRSYANRPFTIQYDESDLSFICRLTEYWGIGFFFEHYKGKDVVVFTDGDQCWELGQVPVFPFTNTGEKIGLFDITLRHSRVPGRYILRDYNPDHPAVDWTRSGVIGNGDEAEIIEYCSNFIDMEEGSLLLRARLDALSASRMIFSGQAAEAVLEVGTKVRVVDHTTNDRKVLSVTAVELSWKAPVFSGDTLAEFSQHFEAVVAGLSVRPERRTPTPRIDGVVPGVIEGGKDQEEYAELDKDGGYCVRLMLDDLQVSPQPLRGVRMVQPFGGQGYGFHFPLRPGTEVALSFIDGNPDRPVIRGAMPNAQHGSPVQSITAKSNIIRTSGGNEINFQDSKGNERIKLTSPHGNSLIQIGSPNFPNSGITLDTLGASAERAGVGKSLLTPVLDTTTQLTKVLSRKQILTSTTDEFEHDWKGILDTPAKLIGAVNHITNLISLSFNINENIHGKGKLNIEQYEIKIDQIERRRKILAAQLTGFEVLRQKAWKKYKLPPEGFLTEKIKDLYDDYFEKEADFREQVYYYWDAQSPTSSEVSRQETENLLYQAEAARRKLMAVIENDLNYIDLYKILETEETESGEKGRIAGDQDSHKTIAKELIDITNKENLYRIEKEQIEAQYIINTEDLVLLDFSLEKVNNFTESVASIGEILQTLTMLEALADQRGANVGWNIAPGPFYAPGLEALETGVPPLLGEELPENKPSYLSRYTRIVIASEFNGRNFVQGWNTAQTEVSSEHALILSSELRMLQSAKVIAINAWCKETEYVDPAKGFWEKFKDKIKAEGKVAKALKVAGTVANAPNFLLGFLASPISSAVTAAGLIAGLFRNNKLPETPASPAGTLLMRGENRALLTSDRHIEIGAPVVEIASETTRSFANSDHLMLAGTKPPDSASWHKDDANAVFQMAKTGNVVLWSNGKIQFSHSSDGPINVALENSEQPSDTGAIIPPEQRVANDANNNKIVLDDAGFAFRVNNNSNFLIKSGGEGEFMLSSEGIKYKKLGTGFSFQKDSGKIEVKNNGYLELKAGTVMINSGTNSIVLDNEGLRINGNDIFIDSTGDITLESSNSMGIKSNLNVAIKGNLMDIQGTAKTSIGSSSSMSILLGITIMLG